MAEFLKKIPTNLTEYPNSFKRQGAFPLEAYSVFYTKAEADTYAASDPLAYVGQTIAVALDTGVTLYVIDQNSTLKEVGSLPVGDDQSVTVVDGKIQLIGFNDATHGAVAQIKITTDEDSGTTTKELIWTPVSDLVGGEMADLSDQVDDHEERITFLEGGAVDSEGKPIPGAVISVEYEEGTGIFTFTDKTGNSKTINTAIEKVVANFKYYETVTLDGQVYNNVLVLTLADGTYQIVEMSAFLDDTDTNDTYTFNDSDTIDFTVTDNGDKHTVSATLTDSVKEDINKGVEAHDGLSNADSDALLQSEDNVHKVVLKGSIKTDIAKGVEANKAYEGLTNTISDVQLEYSEERGDHRVILSNSIKTDITKGVTAYNALFDGTTTFVLNGGNASGYTVATDESTEV